MHHVEEEQHYLQVIVSPAINSFQTSRFCYCFRIILLNMSYHIRVYLLKNVFEVFLVLALFLPMNLFYVLDTTFLGEELCRHVSTYVLRHTDLLDYFPYL